VEMIHYQLYNKGYRYLLIVIDTFSKQAWAVAIKNKTGDSVTKSMKSIFDDVQRKRKNLQRDDGKEFFNKTFQNLMKLNHINHYSTNSILKDSINEQFNRTIKNMMRKEFSYQGTYKWINIYNALIAKYNNTIKRMAPNDVNFINESFLLDHLKITHNPKFKVDDYVRISKYKHVFEKG